MYDVSLRHVLTLPTFANILPT